MLTREQFLANNAKRYKGLTQDQKDQRYKQYQSSMRGRTKRPTSQAAQTGSAPTPGYNTPRNRQTLPPVLKNLGMSDCALLYLKALTNPWDLDGDPCIPDFITLPSFKFSAICRGTFSIGTVGIGYVAVDPWLTAFNDRDSVMSTTSAYAGSGYTNGGGGTVKSRTNSPVAATTNLVRSLRVVGCGMRIRYAGTEMNRGGRAIAYRQPENMDIDNSDVPTLLTNPEAVSVPVDRNWHAVSFRPARDFDIAYQLVQNVLNPEFSQLLIVSGSTPASSFEFEVKTYFEMIGNSLSNLTRSHSDPAGLAVVNTTLSTHQPTTSPEGDFNAVIRDAGDVAAKALSYIGTGVSTAYKVAAAARPLMALL